MQISGSAISSHKNIHFNVGTKKLRRLAEENTDRFAVFSGNKYLIIRTKFEKFIDESSEI